MPEPPRKAAPTYVCEQCGERFTEGWSEAEAQAEARRHFGFDPANASDFARVCDDCYRAIMRALDHGWPDA
jgi:hypothetical protein